MAITLGSVVLSDAEVTDGIGFGDVAAAARLWVGQWPIALSAARTYVEPDEVPGLAAEALVGTIAAIAVGRGPREDLTAFVVAAVTELGDDDDPPPASRTTTPAPEVFTSAMMTRAFSGLPDEDQEVLRFTDVGDQADELIAESLNIPVPMAAEVRLGALTALQRDYLAEHIESADSAACRQAHAAMAAAVTRSGSLSGETWVHMSECAWCTEAFHELAFSNVALSALVDRAATVPVAPVVPPPFEAVVAPAVVIPGLQEPAPLEPVAAEADTDAPDPVAEPVLAPTPYEPGGFHAAPAASRSGFLRSRRTRLAAGAVLAAAAITVGVLVVSGLNGPDGSLAVASTDQNQDATELPDAFESVAPPTTDELPKPTKSAATPGSTPTPTPTSAATSVAGALPPKPSPTPRPSSAPTTTTPQQSPTRPPVTTTPTATPSTTPTPTPTNAPCTPLAHLLGFC